MEFLKRRLKAAGSDRWEAIAAAAGVAKTLPRKIAYGDRENPRIGTVQPLLDYFREIDEGRRQLPTSGSAAKEPAAVAFNSLPAAVRDRAVAAGNG